MRSDPGTGLGSTLTVAFAAARFARPGRIPTVNASMMRYTVYFSGHVQGVGFRYTAVQIARRFSICGFVYNLRDARVLMVIEGAPDALDRFVAAVQQRMEHYIAQTAIQKGAATGEFSSLGGGHLVIR